jgi:hypothetical protein
MAIMGVSGPTSGLSQFLSSLATSGTTSFLPVGSPLLSSAAAMSAAPANGGSASPPNGAAASATAQNRPQQLASLIQSTMNTLNSDQTGNPLDALKSIESSPGLGGLLGQLNVNPQQFRSDILAAMSQSSTGNLDMSQVFQSFPSGQSLNTLA